MEWIKEYLLCVTAAAIVCGIIKSMVKHKGMTFVWVKLLAGIFLAFTVISPWTTVNGINLSSFSENLTVPADASVSEGQIMAKEAMADIIKQNAQSYILDKAAYLKLSIRVDVKVSQDDLPKPIHVTISGTASPYAKELLTRYIETDLGIPEDEQIWT